MPYLAPSRDGYGWGVFASRSFQQGEIVDVAPMFILVDLEENRAKFLKETILNNYHYEYWAWDGIQATTNQYSMISFGMTLYYNHQSPPKASDRDKNRKCGPNIEQRKIGREPDMECPDRAVAIVYFALRNIEQGEELLVDYGGSTWFKDRGMQEIVMEAEERDYSCLAKDDVERQRTQHENMQQLSGKISYGYHQQSLRRVMEYLDETFEEMQPFRLDSILLHLPKEKVCFGRVTSQCYIQTGETIEYVPALLLPKALIRSTILEPLAIFWDDFEESSPAFQIDGRPDRVFVQYQPDLDDRTPPSTQRDIRAIESVLFALAGSISMMARVCRKSLDSDYNAVLEVEDDLYNQNGYCVRAIACKPIAPGERIILGVLQQDLATDIIVQELCLRGQPFETT